MHTRLLCVLLLFAAESAHAEVQFFDYDLTLTIGLPAVGFHSGVAVRPKGDVRVKNLLKGERFTRGILVSKFWRFRSETEVFMVDRWKTDGPTVVGLNFRTLAEPWTCSSQDGFKMDLPWRNPCVAAGYAYRGSYNTYDYSYGRGTFTHGIQAHMRLFSAHDQHTFMWLWSEWVPHGAMPAFELTEDTDIEARRLENQVFRIGLTKGTAFGKDGQLTGETTFLGSKHGFSSVHFLLRYLHRIDVGLQSTSDEGEVLHKFTFIVGLECESGINFRKTDRVGGGAYNIRLLAGMPIGGD